MRFTFLKTSLRPVSHIFTNVQLPIGVHWPDNAGLFCHEIRNQKTVALILSHMKVYSPGAQGIGHFLQCRFPYGFILPIVALRQNPVFWVVIKKPRVYKRVWAISAWNAQVWTVYGFQEVSSMVFQLCMPPQQISPSAANFSP